MSPFCEVCEKPFTAPNREDHVSDCLICGNECCAQCIGTDRVCKECDSKTVTLMAAEPSGPAPITQEELDPANWEFTNFETDCGWCCTPNGCMGHTTSIPESLSIGAYTIRFPVDDLTDKTDWDNVEAIGNKLKEVFEFYAKHHPKTQAQ